VNPLEWWNFTFLVPLASSLLLGLGAAASGFGAGGSEVGGEAAADTAGNGAESPSALVFEKLVSALRSVAATNDLVEIHAQRDEFASAEQTLVTSDLEQNGLALESVTISRFDQTDQGLLSDNNIFDAQGKRKITEITQSALVERNRIEREALREITMKNVQPRKETLELERDQAQAEAVRIA